jgi:recombinational DNA repair ATPase RecF
MDDLSAELDTAAITRILTDLSERGDQTFVAAVGDRSTPQTRLTSHGGALFHVEQGRLT